MATSESARTFQQSRTPEQRRETALKRWIHKSPEERTAIAQKIVAARTPKLKESQAKRNTAWKKKTPEEREAIYTRVVETKAQLYPLQKMCSKCTIHPRVSRGNAYCLECRREWFAKRNYGLSTGQYQMVMAERVCFLCGQTEGRFHIDHDHKTHRVRGLLCHLCNWFVGHMENIDVDIVAKAIRYVDGENLQMKPEFPVSKR